MKNKQIFSESTPPCHKGLFARFRSLRFMLVMLLATLGVNVAFGANDVVLVSSNLTDISGLSGSSAITIKNDKGQTYLLKNSSDVTIATFTGTGCKWNDTSNKPTSTGAEGYSMYIRFGSSGNLFECEPNANFVKGGKVRLLVSGEQTNTTKKYATVKIGDASLGDVMAYSAKATCDWQEFDIPSTIDAQHAKITITRTDNTFFLWGIEILTNSSSSGPVDPTATFADANYEIGETLDLASKLTSNSEGTVTYTVKDAGTTGASISGSNFTATAAGTAVVTASQAAVADKYNAGSWDATITVTAPVAKYAVNFAAGEGTGTMDALEYAENAEVTLPACTFTAPDGKEFDAWTSSDVTITDGKFTMPANEVTVTATWKNLPAGRTIVYDLKTGVGSAELGTTGTMHSSTKYTEGTIITLGQTADYVILTPVAGKTFKNGDLVEISGTNGNSSKKYGAIIKTAVSDGATAATLTVTPNSNKEGSVSGTLSLTAPVSALYVTRGDGTTMNFTEFTISREAEVELPKHHVTYAKGEATCEIILPTQVDVEENSTFTIADAIACAGLDFTGWNDGAADYAAGATYTMGTADVVLTAQWTAHVASSDATLSDLKVNDATVEGFAAATENYNVVLPFGTAAVPTVTATAADANAKSVVVTPAASLPGTTTVVVTAEDNTTTKTYTINFTVATSLDVEMIWDKSKKRCDGTTPAANVNSSAFAQYLSFAFAGGGAEGSSLNTSNNAGGSFTLSAKDGFAFKSMSFFGKLQADVEFSIDGGAFTTLATTSTSSDKCYSDVFADAEVHEFVLRNTAANGAWIRNMQLEVIASTKVVSNIIYAETKGAVNSNPTKYIEGVGVASFVALGDVDGWHFLGWDKTSISAEATGEQTITAQWESTLSTDVTLSSLKYGEETIATAADKFVYNVTLPYGAAVPTVTAVANNANATVGEITQANAENSYYASFWVTAEDGTTKQAYQVRFTWAPKQGVSIIKATHTGATTASVEGMIGGSIDKNTQSGGKLGSPDHYFGIKLAEGTFLAGDVLTIYASTTSTKVQIFSDKGTNMLNEGVFVDNVYTFTLEAATEWIYLYRTSTAGSAMNPTLGYMEVRRAMPSIVKSYTIAEVEATIDQVAKTITAEVPYGTVVADAIAAAEVVAYANGSAHVAKNADNVTVTSDYAEDGEVVYTLDITVGAVVASNVSVTDPTGATYNEGDVIAALSVVATKETEDEGVLSYQWYKENGATDIAVGTNSNEFTPTEAGEYYVVVSNTLGESVKTATSNPATIIIKLKHTFADWTSGTSFTKTGEWTIYSATSDGAINGSTKFKSAQQIDKTDATIKANALVDQRFLVKFDVDVTQVVLHAYASSTGRTLNNVQVASTASKGSYTNADFTITNNTLATNYDYEFIVDGFFKAGKYYWFQFNGTVNVFDFFFTEAVYESVRDVTPGLIGTICLSKEVLAVRGATFYQIEKPTAIGVDFVEATEFPAGTPFIFEAEATEIEVVYGEGTATEGLTINGLVGNLGVRDVIPNDGHQNYIIYNNHLAYCVPGNTNYVGQNRAYIQLDAVVDMSESEQVGEAPRRRISMGGAETEVTTGMEAIESVEAQKILRDGTIIILRGGKMYNVNGQLLK